MPERVRRDSMRWARHHRRRINVLKRVNFAAIEVAGGDRRTSGHVLKWSQKIKAQLNKQLWAHCERGSHPTPFPHLSIDKTEAKLLANTVALFDRLKPKLEGGANALVNSRWRRFSGALDDVRPLVKSRRGKPGPKPNIWLDEFIVIVADAYYQAGGNVSAQPNSITKKLETPFLRVLRIVYQCLPRQHPSITLSALDERARRTGIPLWKNTRANCDGFPRLI